MTPLYSVLPTCRNHRIRAALIAIGAVALLALVAPAQTASSLATTYLLKGTQAFGHIHTDQGVIDSKLPWITGMSGTAPPETIIVVDYPASMWPISLGGFSSLTFAKSVSAGVAAIPSPDTIESGAVFGAGSQGVVVTSLYKRHFNGVWATRPQEAPDITAVLVENPMRPGGGILQRLVAVGRLPVLDIPFYGASPTETAGAERGEITTYDVSPQYNFFSDFPTNPLFVLSVINSIVGQALVPLITADNVPDAVLQDEYGDTRYYLVPTYPVPILLPLNMIPKVGPILADMLDPAMRLLVEAGYDRTLSPGQAVSANLRYFPDPAALARNLVRAIPTGLDNGLEQVFDIRPFGTQRPDVMGQGAYGINAPPVTITPSADVDSTDDALPDDEDLPTESALRAEASNSESVVTNSTRKLRNLRPQAGMPRQEGDDRRMRRLASAFRTADERSAAGAASESDGAEAAGTSAN